MKKTGRFFIKFQDWLMVIMMVLMLAFVLIATFLRFIKVPALTWSEEFARTLMVWVGLLGSGIVTRQGNHFAVDVVYAHTKGAVQKGFFIFLLLANEAFAVFTVMYGVIICMKQYNMTQVSAAMQVPMWILYMAVPLMGISIGLQAPVYYVPLITGKEKYGSEIKAEPEGE